MFLSSSFLLSLYFFFLLTVTAKTAPYCVIFTTNIVAMDIFRKLIPKYFLLLNQILFCLEGLFLGLLSEAYDSDSV